MAAPNAFNPAENISPANLPDLGLPEIAGLPDGPRTRYTKHYTCKLSCFIYLSSEWPADRTAGLNYLDTLNQSIAGYAGPIIRSPRWGPILQVYDADYVTRMDMRGGNGLTNIASLRSAWSHTKREMYDILEANGLVSTSVLFD